jgi:GGDEF domain-containing protein
MGLPKRAFIRLILTPNCSLELARTAGERVRKAVSGTLFTNPDAEQLPPVTISVGVAEMCEDSTVEALIAHHGAEFGVAHRSGIGSCVPENLDAGDRAFHGHG